MSNLNLQYLFKGAAEAYMEKSFTSAVQIYKQGLQIMEQSKEKEIKTEQYLIQYLIALIYSNSDDFDSLIEALVILTKLGQKYFYKIPTIYSTLANIYYKLYSFDLAREAVKVGFQVLRSNEKFQTLCLPETDFAIKETEKEHFEQSLLEMKEKINRRTKPNGICCMSDCKEVSHPFLKPRRDMYFSDPSFIGLVRVTCSNWSNSFTVNYHISCWKIKKEQLSPTKTLSDKNIIGLSCFSPKCAINGNLCEITLIEIIGKDGQLQTSVGTKPESNMTENAPKFENVMHKDILNSTVQNQMKNDEDEDSKDISISEDVQKEAKEFVLLYFYSFIEKRRIEKKPVTYEEVYNEWEKYKRLSERENPDKILDGFKDIVDFLLKSERFFTSGNLIENVHSQKDDSKKSESCDKNKTEKEDKNYDYERKIKDLIEKLESMTSHANNLSAEKKELIELMQKKDEKIVELEEKCIKMDKMLNFLQSAVSEKQVMMSNYLKSEMVMRESFNKSLFYEQFVGAKRMIDSFKQQCLTAIEVIETINNITINSIGLTFVNASEWKISMIGLEKATANLKTKFIEQNFDSGFSVFATNLPNPPSVSLAETVKIAFTAYLNYMILMNLNNFSRSQLTQHILGNSQSLLGLPLQTHVQQHQYQDLSQMIPPYLRHIQPPPVATLITNQSEKPFTGDSRITIQQNVTIDSNLNKAKLPSQFDGYFKNDVTKHNNFKENANNRTVEIEEVGLNKQLTGMKMSSSETENSENGQTILSLTEESEVSATSVK